MEEFQLRGIAGFFLIIVGVGIAWMSNPKTRGDRILGLITLIIGALGAAYTFP